jgi:hypothetical protein
VAREERGITGKIGSRKIEINGEWLIRDDRREKETEEKFLEEGEKKRR